MRSQRAKRNHRNQRISKVNTQDLVMVTAPRLKSSAKDEAKAKDSLKGNNKNSRLKSKLKAL